MATTDNTRAARLKVSATATGTHTTYNSALPLEIQQLMRDSVGLKVLCQWGRRYIGDPKIGLESCVLEERAIQLYDG